MLLSPTSKVWAVAERSNPMSREWRLRQRRRAKRSYFTFKVRRGALSKVRSSGYARDPSKTVGVARGHQRGDTLKPQSQKTSQSDPRTTAVSNSVKLSHAVWGHPRRSGHGRELWQNVVPWRREWQTTPVFLP